MSHSLSLSSYHLAQLSIFVIVLGDFNLSNINWDSLSGCSNFCDWMFLDVTASGITLSYSSLLGLGAVFFIIISIYSSNGYIKKLPCDTNYSQMANDLTHMSLIYLITSLSLLSAIFVNTVWKQVAKSVFEYSKSIL